MKAFDFSVTCELTGGLLMGDRQNLENLSNAEILGAEIGLSEDGNTDLMYDYPGERWEEVFARETRALRRLCESGHVLFLNLGEGLFFGEVETCDGGDASKTKKGWLYSPTGVIAAANPGVEGGLLKSVAFELKTDPGWYCVYVSHSDRDDCGRSERVVGEFGLRGQPAIVVGFERLDSPSLTAGANWFFKKTEWLASWRRADDLVAARIKRIEGGHAIGRIVFPSGDGYVQFSHGDAGLAAGEDVVLRLLENLGGGRWDAEFVRMRR
ncbi:hypothetical protein LZ198_42245 [Myxococcus sp. K15C18031901]|uniref:hypothetical protein n=1 Tax=Myxococcus dinghuensis TaxID=2906761 RepID=UPI0020A7425D|nr:hypothetical protein [Myxococcus dinghuensis]MCP3105499.1 hypothetical protein [Myxococcus dinghuensis]